MHRLQGVRGGMPQSQRTGRRRDWRKVGLLVGGSSRLPVLQHVTTACHHCVEPACMEGCPVQAYEKDPVTGIVRHLDDQCIGCQYCILKCPYDVPRYSKSKGIVRKCDMCTNRLAGGRGPGLRAGVSRIRQSASRSSIRKCGKESRGEPFSAGAPEPGYTKPSTVYKTRKPLPTICCPPITGRPPQHSHLPLVWMLVLTQMSVGALAIEQVLIACRGGRPSISAAVHVRTAPGGAADRFDRAFRRHFSPWPSALRLSRHHRLADFLAEPRDPGL